MLQSESEKRGAGDRSAVASCRGETRQLLHCVFRAGEGDCAWMTAGVDAEGRGGCRCSSAARGFAPVDSAGKKESWREVHCIP